MSAWRAAERSIKEMAGGEKLAEALLRGGETLAMPVLFLFCRRHFYMRSIWPLMAASSQLRGAGIAHRHRLMKGVKLRPHR